MRNYHIHDQEYRVKSEKMECPPFVRPFLSQYFPAAKTILFRTELAIHTLEMNADVPCCRDQSSIKIFSISLGNGLTERREYDRQGRITSQSLGDLFEKSWDYDANGNVLNIAQSASGTAAPDQNYTFDAIDRLVSESGQFAASFSCDANDNRTQLSEGETSTACTCTLKSNRLNKAGDRAIARDAAGNTLSDGPTATSGTTEDGWYFWRHWGRCFGWRAWRNPGSHNCRNGEGFW